MRSPNTTRDNGRAANGRRGPATGVVANALSRLMEIKDPILVIGAHDGLGGRLGQRAGFDAIWASGFEIAASHGLPDANILDLTAQLTASAAIKDAVTIPVIADCDNGYGNAVNSAHMARKFHRAGIDAVC